MQQTLRASQKYEKTHPSMHACAQHQMTTAEKSRSPALVVRREDGRRHNGFDPVGIRKNAGSIFGLAQTPHPSRMNGTTLITTTTHAKTVKKITGAHAGTGERCDTPPNTRWRVRMAHSTPPTPARHKTLHTQGASHASTPPYKMQEDNAPMRSAPPMPAEQHRPRKHIKPEEKNHVPHPPTDFLKDASSNAPIARAPRTPLWK